MQHVHSFANFLNEGKVSVKRKYTDAHPEVTVGDRAPIREKVLNFIKEKGTVSRTELREFISGLNEETGKGSSNKWIARNSNYLKVVEKDGECHYTLSALGRKVESATSKKNSSKVNESADIDRFTKEFFSIVNTMKDTADKWKKAEGDEKVQLLQTLKDLTAKKKEIEDKLNSAIASKDRGLELIISED